MIGSLTIRLFPTKQQEVLMHKHVGSMRFVYNWGLSRQMEYYKQNNKTLSFVDLGKNLTQLKNTEGYKWLYEVSSASLKDSLRDLEKAYQRFFCIQREGVKFTKSKILKAQRLGNQLTLYDLKGHPKFKSKKKAQYSFYVRYDSLYFTDNMVNLEKIGKVRYRTNYQIPQNVRFSNPRVKFNGRIWLLTVGYEVSPEKFELTDVSLGIDLGIKMLAVTNIDGLEIKNINKTVRVRKLEEKLKLLQRQVSRKYEMNKDGQKYQKTQNIIKLEKKIRRLHNRLANIRLNYIHQATSTMMKTKPYRVVMETLNVQNMMKNKHLAKAIQQQGFAEFIRQMKYKCEAYGIDFLQVPSNYPSSKTCSHCGAIKKDLKLSDRVYNCSCGFQVDRDKNAAYNLANYGLN